MTKLCVKTHIEINIVTVKWKGRIKKSIIKSVCECVSLSVCMCPSASIYMCMSLWVCVLRRVICKNTAELSLTCNAPALCMLTCTSQHHLSLSLSLSLFLYLSFSFFLSLSHSGIHTHAVYFLSQYLSALSSPVTAGRFALCGIVLLASEPRAADTSIMFSLYAPWGRAWEGRIEGGLRERDLGSVTIHEKGQKEMHWRLSETGSFLAI